MTEAKHKRHHWKPHELERMIELMKETEKAHADWSLTDRCRLVAAQMTTSDWRPTYKVIQRKWWQHLNPEKHAHKPAPAQKVGHPMGPQIPLPIPPSVDLTPLVDALLEGLALLPSAITEALEPMVARMEAAAAKMTQKEGTEDDRKDD